MNNKPSIRFREFSAPFEEELIGNLFNLKNGVAKPAKYFGYGNSIIGLMDVFGSNSISKKQNEFDKVYLNSKEVSEFKLIKGDTLIIRSSVKREGVAQSAVILEDYDDTAFSGFLIRLRDVNSYLDIMYKKYCFYSSNFRNQVLKFASTSANTNINQESLEKIILYFPSIKEQQKIASFLTSVDDKINLLTKKKELIEEYKKGVIQKIFSQEIRFKDDNGNDFPDWYNVELGRIIEESSFRNKDKKMSLVLSVSNKKGFISQDEQFEGYKVASKDLSNYKIVYKNEYAYNPSRINVGSIARLDKYDKGIVSPMYIVFRLSNKLFSGYFDLLINSHYVKHLIKVGCSGSVRDSLNFSEMKKFNINLPSLEEQKKIGNFMNQLNEKLKLINSQIDKTKEFKKGLLQQMFV